MLKYLIILLYPFVKLSDWLTGGLHGPTLSGFSREGVFGNGRPEFKRRANCRAGITYIKEPVTTARNPCHRCDDTAHGNFFVVADVTVEEFFHKYDHVSFSRIPIYSDEQENISGFVFRSDLLLAKARGNGDSILSNYRHDITAVPGSMSLSQVFNELLKLRVHMMLVVDEYGGVEGIITLEDVLETLLGLEIVDEKDDAVDMQKEARRQWKRRAGKMGLKIDGEK